MKVIYFRAKDKDAVKSRLSGPAVDEQDPDKKLKKVLFDADIEIDQAICVVPDGGSGKSIWSAVVSDEFVEFHKLKGDFLGVGMDELKLLNEKDYEKIAQKYVETEDLDEFGNKIKIKVDKEYKEKAGEVILEDDIPLHTFFGYDAMSGLPTF